MASRSSRRERLQRLLVALESLPADRLLERRRRIVGHLRGQLRHARPVAHLAHLVVDAVLHRLAQVRLQRAGAAHFERVQVRQRLHHRILDQVLRVGGAAGPLRQAAARPASQRRQAALDELVTCRGVSAPVQLEQLQRPGRMVVRGCLEGLHRRSPSCAAGAPAGGRALSRSPCSTPLKVDPNSCAVRATRPVREGRGGLRK